MFDTFKYAEIERGKGATMRSLIHSQMVSTNKIESIRGKCDVMTSY